MINLDLLADGNYLHLCWLLELWRFTNLSQHWLCLSWLMTEDRSDWFDGIIWYDVKPSSRYILIGWYNWCIYTVYCSSTESHWLSTMKIQYCWQPESHHWATWKKKLWNDGNIFKLATIPTFCGITSDLPAFKQSNSDLKSFMRLNNQIYE